MKKNIEFRKYLSQKIEYVNLMLKKILPKDNSTLSKNMRYSVLSGGKRLRPILVILAAEFFGAKAGDVIPAACAVEYMHAYSLVHDDLPAMDNDDFRRGVLSSHKKFGEASAILCGDALLTESFNLITKSKSSEKNINAAVRVLANYGGYKGLIAGQAEDIDQTEMWARRSRILMKQKLKFIQIQKTAALIIASLKIGAILVDADEKSLKAFENYGENIGIAFQITDDILDVYADKKLLGKKGSDIENNKLTTLSLYSKQEAEKKVLNCIKKAKKTMAVFGDKSGMFIKLADYIAGRTY